jgi:type II secretory pathway pseudopilin PulG
MELINSMNKEWICMRFRFFRVQRGVSLIETVVALGLLGLIGVALLSGLTTTSKAVMVSQEDVTVESLAKSQIEHIKAQPYIPISVYQPEYCYDKITDIPANYDIEIMPPEAPPLDAGVGPFEVQSITVVVKRNGKAVFTMLMYREGSSAV